MPSTFPVVEIDNRNRPSVAAYKTSIKRDQSSSPIYISSNNVATGSKSKVNGLDGSSNALRAPVIGNQANTSQNGVDKKKTPSSNVVPTRFISSRLKEVEVVQPPAGEPRLKSLFDDSWAGSCVWAPSHRLARAPALVTCQWIVNDEGFGEVEKCEKIFTTVESLTKHVHYAHCEPSRPVLSNSNVHITSSRPLLSCAWDTCKYKRFKPVDLKVHILDHLRSAAFSCPFQQCRSSLQSTMESADLLDSHIQTYHTNGESLRPLGIPKPIKLLIPNDLPDLPAPFPQWMINNPPIGIPREPRRRPPSPSPEPAEGEVRPWDQLWLELNKREPPAITIDAVPTTEGPTIEVATMPIAIALPIEPKKRSLSHLEVEAPPPSSKSKIFIDLTQDDVDIYPPAPEPKYNPAVDMTAVSLAKREAKRDHHRRRFRLGVASNSTSRSSAEMATSSGGEEGASSEDPNSVVERLHKRLKVEE